MMITSETSFAQFVISATPCDLVCRKRLSRGVGARGIELSLVYTQNWDPTLGHNFENASCTERLCLIRQVEGYGAKGQPLSPAAGFIQLGHRIDQRDRPLHKKRSKGSQCGEGLLSQIGDTSLNCRGFRIQDIRVEPALQYYGSRFRIRIN